jgi:hypothetical protein
MIVRKYSQWNGTQRAGHEIPTLPAWYVVDLFIIPKSLDPVTLGRFLYDLNPLESALQSAGFLFCHVGPGCLDAHLWLLLIV